MVITEGHLSTPTPTPYSHLSYFFSLARKRLNISICQTRSYKSERATMDDITVVKPAAMPDAGSAPELPTSNEPAIEPLDVVQEPKVRTKLRIYSILVALYVH